MKDASITSPMSGIKSPIVKIKHIKRGKREREREGETEKREKKRGERGREG